MYSSPNPERMIELAVCPDCLVWIANHDDSGVGDAAETADFHRRYKKGSANLSDLIPGDAEDGYFSWRHCDVCDALPGNRYPIIAYLCD